MTTMASSSVSLSQDEMRRAETGHSAHQAICNDIYNDERSHDEDEEHLGSDR